MWMLQCQWHHLHWLPTKWLQYDWLIMWNGISDGSLLRTCDWMLILGLWLDTIEYHLIGQLYQYLTGCCCLLHSLYLFSQLKRLAQSIDFNRIVEPWSQAFVVLLSRKYPLTCTVFCTVCYLLARVVMIACWYCAKFGRCSSVMCVVEAGECGEIYMWWMHETPLYWH